MKKILLVLATLVHLLPHPFGVTPIGALALYAGACGDRRRSWLIPLLPVALGAAIVGLFDPIVMIFVFAGFALSTQAGRWLLARDRSLSRYAAAIVAGASIFFLLSNFSVWLAGFYPPTAAGLAECLANGLPFLFRALAADAAYCCLLFGAHELIERSAEAPAVA